MGVILAFTGGVWQEVLCVISCQNGIRYLISALPYILVHIEVGIGCAKTPIGEPGVFNSPARNHG